MADSYRAQTVDFCERRLKIREAQAKESDALESLFYEELKTKDNDWYNRWKVQYEKTGIQEASIKSLECENEALESENKSLRADLRADLNTARAGHPDQQAVINGHSHGTSDSFEKDAKIKSLESEIQSLQGILASNNDGIRDRPATNDPSGDEALKVKYKALEGEFGRVTAAKDALESRCRRYKEILKEWREYEKIWIMRKGPRSAVNRGSLGLAVPLEEHHGSTGIPAPPKPPAASMSTPTNNQSTSISPSSGIRILQAPGQQQLRGYRGDTNRSSEGATKADRTINVQLNDLDGKETTDTAEEIDSRPTEVEDLQSLEGSWTTYLRETDPRPANEDENSPVVVSERSLKRKRPSVKKEAQLDIREAVIVKDEPVSNLPIIAVSSQPLSGVQDSLDLDDIRGSVDTPRKRERLVQMRLMSSLDDSLPFQNQTRLQVDTQKQDEDAVLETSTTEDEDDDSHSPAPDSRWMGHFPTTSLAPQKREVRDHENKQKNAFSKSEQFSLEGRVHKGRTPSGSGDQFQSPPSKKPEGTRSRKRPHQRSAEPFERVLPVSKDDNAPPRTRTGKRRPVPSSHRDRGAAQIPTLAEDGEDFAPSKGPRHSRRGPSILESMLKGEVHSVLKDRPPNPHHRLGALLNDPAPERAASPKAKPDLRLSRTAASPRTPIESCRKASVHRAQHNFYTAHVYQSNALDRHGVKSATTNSSASGKDSFDEGRSPSLRNPPEVLPEHEPLRVRSVDRLRLSDFKLNKNHTEFAFHESVRKHDEKRRIGGCTDPFCDRCKELARFAELTEFVAAPAGTLFGSSSSSSPPQAQNAEAAEDKMLEEYLGHDRQRLRRMSGGERAETLKKARAKVFADMYGRHRQVHHRAVSPPGYWETEFPSTQQEAENREAAKAIDKVRIRERYDEAMRGGLWKFADE